MAKTYLNWFDTDYSIQKIDASLFDDYPELAALQSVKHLTDFIKPDDPEEFVILRSKLENNEIECFSVEGIIKNIKPEFHACFFIQNYYVSDNKASIQGILTVSQRHIESNSNEIIDSIFQHNPLPFYCFDTSGKFIELNQKLLDFTGLDEATLKTLHFADLIHPEDLPQTEKYFQQALNGISNQYDLRVVLPDRSVKIIRVNKFPRIVAGTITGVYGIFEDVTDKHESEQRWRKLVEQNPLPVIIFVDKTFVFANTAAASFYGFENADEIIGRHIFDFVPEHEKKILQEREQQILNNRIIAPRESILHSADGSIRNIVVHARKINYEGNEAIQSVLFDITELKKQRQLIEKSLQEKEILLKEIHHRVKNNLAIISGLIELQIQTIKDKGTIAVLRDSQNRIQSIALVHQQLYQSESFDEISLDVYLSDLIAGLKHTIDGSKKIDFRIESEEIKVSIEHAIPCSLIVNEVVINAFKHAYDDVDDPELKISINRKENDVVLTVRDNGVGIENKVSPSSKPSLGTTLVNILTQQLDGTSNYINNPTRGTCFKLQFPIG